MAKECLIKIAEIKNKNKDKEDDDQTRRTAMLLAQGSWTTWMCRWPWHDLYHLKQIPRHRCTDGDSKAESRVSISYCWFSLKVWKCRRPNLSVEDKKEPRCEARLAGSKRGMTQGERTSTDGGATAASAYNGFRQPKSLFMGVKMALLLKRHATGC